MEMTQNAVVGDGGAAGALALNTSFANTSISAISDTMITYEGQPARTRFLTPYFKKDPKAPLLEETHNRGLYGEGLWMPNTTAALAPSVPLGHSRAAAARKVRFDSEPKLTSESLAAIRASMSATTTSTAAAVGGGVGESKSESKQTQTQAQAHGQGQGQRSLMTKSIVSSMVDRISNTTTGAGAGAGAGVEAEVRSTTSMSTTTASQPTVEALAERPHRAYIAPRDNLVGSSLHVRKGKSKGRKA